MKNYIDFQIFIQLFLLGFLLNSVTRRLAMEELPKDFIYPLIMFIVVGLHLFLLLLYKKYE